MGRTQIEKIRTEEIRARAGVANIGETIREERLRWLGHVCGEKDRRCSNKSMEDGSVWTPKYRKTKTEVKWCYKKRHSIERSTDRRSTRRQNPENEK